MPSVSIPVGRGSATGIDTSLIDDGQLQESVGVVYDVSNPAAKKMGGRTVYNATPIASSAVQNILYFDSVNGNPKLIAQCNNSIVTSPMDGVFTAASGGAGIANLTDSVVFNDKMILATDSITKVISSGGTIRRLGLAMTDQNTLLLGGGAAGNPNGTYTAWITEYDSVNQVESAIFVGTVSSPSSISVVNSKVVYTINTSTASFSNSSADSYRIYRSIGGGVYPNGWLVTTQLKTVTSYTDNLSDANLVSNDPYPIVTINDISESLNFDQQANFISVDAFQGSIVAVGGVGDTLYYSETGLIDSWPSSYKVRFNPLYGGSSNCVRSQGDACYVFFNHETFMVNYLPKASDAVFDGGIAQKKIANYGTASPNGAVMFTGFGNKQAILLFSTSGPMILMDGVMDRAVSNIDWPNTVVVPYLSICKAIDNPQKQRVELFFVDSATDTTSWSSLHFYYDSERLTNKTGPLPELAWTGPHKVPGPGCYAVQKTSTGNGNGIVFTGSRQATGVVYLEDDGSVDNALLIDSSGTVNFRLRTKKIYPAGMDGEVRADRLHIHKGSDNIDPANPDYTVTFYAHREESGVFPTPTSVHATEAGLSSVGLNTSARGCDVRITYDGTTAMPPINNITLRYEDAEKFGKTTR